MNQQLSFFNEPEPCVAKYNLFLGIFPDSGTARSIIELADTLRRKHGLRGRVRPVSHSRIEGGSNSFESGFFSSPINSSNVDIL